MNNIGTNQKINNDRLYLLDAIRILSALFIFFFHSNMHMGYTYGFLTPFISQGAIFMAAFFILSGFSMYYNYSNQDMYPLKKITNFYFKRIIGIYPLYIATYILFLIFFNNISTIKNIIIAPIELLLLQSFFHGSFSVLHNGGTWFISCIFYCYLLFPFYKIILEQIKRYKLFILFIVYCLCSFAPVVSVIFNFGSVYSNPFFRSLEFIAGMVVADLFLNFNVKRNNRILIILIAIEWIALIGGITLLQKFGLGSYEVYNFITFPIFCAMIYHLACLKNLRLGNAIFKTKIIQYLSKISYAFFLAQFFTWSIVRYLQKNITIIESHNSIKILTSLIICYTISILLYELIQKPIDKILKNVNLNRELKKNSVGQA